MNVTEMFEAGQFPEGEVDDPMTYYCDFCGICHPDGHCYEMED